MKLTYQNDHNLMYTTKMPLIMNMLEKMLSEFLLDIFVLRQKLMFPTAWKKTCTYSDSVIQQLYERPYPA
jgi:hypothetical protein